MLAAVVFYARTTGHELLWDDPPLLRSLWPGPEGASFLDVVFALLAFSQSYFRPLGTATLLLELRLGGGPSAAVHHGVNVALHAANTLLVGLLALRTARGPAWLAALTAAAYALHPALVEGVAFVSSRFDLLVTLFLLAALFADAAILHAGRRAAAVAVLFLLAALAKEMAATFVLVLPLVHVARADRDAGGRRNVVAALREHRPVYAATLLAGLVYLVLRACALPHLLPQPEPTQVVAGGGLTHALLVAKSFGTYIALTIWPFGHLSPVHFTEQPVATDDVLAWSSLALLALISALAVIRRSRLDSPALLTLAALAALLPVVNLRPLALGGGAFVAERFLLFPVALAVVAGATAIARIRLRTPLAACAGLWVLAAAFQTADTIPSWESRRTLWTWAMGHAPESALPVVNLSLAETHAGHPVVGEALARRAIALQPESEQAHTNLGLALFLMGRYQEAHDAYSAALEITSDSPLLWSNFGRTLLELGRPAEAEHVLLERALTLDASLPMAHQNLAEVYWRTGHLERADAHLRKALPGLAPAEQEWARGRLREIEQARERR